MGLIAFAALVLVALLGGMTSWPTAVETAEPGKAGTTGRVELPVSQGDRPSVSPKPRMYFLYIHHDRDPLVVDNYREEKGEIVFEKYGGKIRIPKDEILRIVPDQPDSLGLVQASGPSLLPSNLTSQSPTTLYLFLRGGGNLKVSKLVQEKDRLRLTLDEGSFTIPTAEVVGILRIRTIGEQQPEAWLEVKGEGAAAGAPLQPESATPATETATRSGPILPSREQGAPPTVSASRSSDRPHLLQTASGRTIRVDKFWIEAGEVKFSRFGGVVGIPLSDVRKLTPEASGQERTPARLVRLVGPTLLEVRVKGEMRRVRLLGVEAIDGLAESRDPWRRLTPGSVLQLEYDREVEEGDRTLLAYVFLPSGRMLNAELIRLGLARPLVDPRALRYLDLFYELEGQPRSDLKK